MPLARGNNAILMEYIGDESLPAPTLNTVNLEQDEAQLLFERCLENIRIMLKHDRIHGDLSAYNILYWNGGIKLIDFPQVINPHENRNAYTIFKRDVTRICEYFGSQGVDAEPKKLANELWAEFRHSTGPVIDPLTQYHLDQEEDLQEDD